MGEAESDLTSSQLAQYDSIFHYAATHGVILAGASGDNGANGSTSSPTMDYPSADPNLVGAGGTTSILKDLSSTTATYGNEYAWNSSGDEISTYFPEQSYQSNAGISLSGIGVPDVFYYANSNTGVWIYDTAPYQGIDGWGEVSGTSAAAPQWAAIFADAQSIHGFTNINGQNVHNLLYSIYSSSSYSSAFHDITVG